MGRAALGRGGPRGREQSRGRHLGLATSASIEAGDTTRAVGPILARLSPRGGDALGGTTNAVRATEEPIKSSCLLSALVGAGRASPRFRGAWNSEGGVCG